MSPPIARQCPGRRLSSRCFLTTCWSTNRRFGMLGDEPLTWTHSQGDCNGKGSDTPYGHGGGWDQPASWAYSRGVEPGGDLRAPAARGQGADQLAHVLRELPGLAL